MSRYAFIDNIFGSDEIEENDAFDEDDDDLDDDDSDGVYDSDGEASDDEDDLAVEDDAMLARLDKDFRKLRARVRASNDPSELRSIRFDQTAALAGPLTPTTRLRTIDIIEAIDDRVTDLRARRGRSD
jgi:hypothetical protein